MKIQNINVMKILVAVMQLLYEDVRRRDKQIWRTGSMPFEAYCRQSATNYCSSRESSCPAGSHNYIKVITALAKAKIPRKLKKQLTPQAERTT